jgi:thioesterase domain-containing protein
MAALLVAVEEQFGVSGSTLELEFCEAPTIATQALAVARAREAGVQADLPRGVIRVARAGGTDHDRAARPLFFIPLAGGNPYYLMPFAARVAGSRPLYFLDAEALGDGAEPTVEALAAACARAIQAVDPTGPYLLSGHCFGGIVAYEVARQLRAAGWKVGMLALVDAPMPGYPHPTRDAWAFVRAAAYYSWRSVTKGGSPRIAAAALGSLARHVRRLVQGRMEQAVTLPGQSSARMLWRYRPRPCEGRVFQVIARDHDQTGTPLDRRLGWHRLVGAFDVSLVAGTHFTMFDEEHVDDVVAYLERSIAASCADARVSQVGSAPALPGQQELIGACLRPLRANRNETAATATAAVAAIRPHPMASRSSPASRG